MPSNFDINIRTTADTSGATATQAELEKTAEAGNKIVDAVTRGDRAAAAFEADLRKLSPEQISRVEREMNALAIAEERAGRDASTLRSQLERVSSIKVDKQASIFAGVTGGALAAQAITGVVSAIRQNISAAIDLGDRLDDLSSRSGVAASALQTIGNVASLDGGSIDTLAAGLSRLTVSAQNAAAGSKPLSESFARLGISASDLQSLSPDELFYKIADAVSTTSDRGRAYADVVSVMGRESVNLFATLERGGDAIRGLGTEMGVFSDSTVSDLARAKDSLVKLQTQLTIFAGNAISSLGQVKEFATQTLTDTFSRFFGLSEEEINRFDFAMDKAAQGGPKFKKSLNDSAGAAGELGTAVGNAASEIDKLNTRFSQRSFAKLPLDQQLVSLQEAIEKVRSAAAQELPGVTFNSAATLATIANSKTGELRETLLKLASQYADLEDAVTKNSGAQSELNKEQEKAAKSNLAEKINAEATALREEQRALLEQISSGRLSNAAREQAAQKVAEIEKQIRKLLDTQKEAPKPSEGLEKWLTDTATAAGLSTKQLAKMLTALKTLYAEQAKAPAGPAVNPKAPFGGDPNNYIPGPTGPIYVAPAGPGLDHGGDPFWNTPGVSWGPPPASGSFSRSDPSQGSQSNSGQEVAPQIQQKLADVQKASTDGFSGIKSALDPIPAAIKTAADPLPTKIGEVHSAVTTGFSGVGDGFDAMSKAVAAANTDLGRRIDQAITRIGALERQS